MDLEKCYTNHWNLKIRLCEWRYVHICRVTSWLDRSFHILLNKCEQIVTQPNISYIDTMLEQWNENKNKYT